MPSLIDWFLLFFIQYNFPCCTSYVHHFSASHYSHQQPHSQEFQASHSTNLLAYFNYHNTLANNTSTMAARRVTVERDSRGRERIVLRPASRARSRSQGHLCSVQEREDALTAEIASLRDQLSFAKMDSYELQKLQAEHYQCRANQAQLEARIRGFTLLKDDLAEEREDNKKLNRKIEKLEEKIRLMKRGSGESFRTKYEDASLDAETYAIECEQLRLRIAEQNEELLQRRNDIRVLETRLIEKNTTIVERNSTIDYLKHFLSIEGYRVTL